MENTEKNAVGGIVGSIIIVVLLLAGAWYFFNNRPERAAAPDDVVIEVTEMSTSTEITDIESDFEKINIDTLDQ
jgi:hypothetical protein